MHKAMTLRHGETGISVGSEHLNRRANDSLMINVACLVPMLWRLLLNNVIIFFLICNELGVKLCFGAISVLSPVMDEDYEL
jgi:hypothetical protein